MEQTLDVLIYVCSPNITPLPQAHAEAHGIAACCERANKRPLVASGDDEKLRELLARHTPQIVHFICHTDAPPGDAMRLVDERGGLVIVRPQKLVDII
eukprot:7382724-Prymnesium_polylepis.1